MAKSDEPRGGRGKNEPQLRRDSLVGSVAPDPSNVEPTITLVGYLGEGAEAGRWRLYLTPEFSEYVEFDEQAVVHNETASPEQVSSGGTVVWLRHGTTLRHTRIASQQVQAEFLQGSISSGFMSRSGFSMGAVGTRAETGYTCTRNYVCSINRHIPACQERTDFCGSTFCPLGSEFVCT